METPEDFTKILVYSMTTVVTPTLPPNTRRLSYLLALPSSAYSSHSIPICSPIRSPSCSYLWLRSAYSPSGISTKVINNMQYRYSPMHIYIYIRTPDFFRYRIHSLLTHFIANPSKGFNAAFAFPFIRPTYITVHHHSLSGSITTFIQKRGQVSAFPFVSPTITLVNLLISGAVLLTYPLQLYPAVQVRSPNRRGEEWVSGIQTLSHVHHLAVQARSQCVRRWHVHVVLGRVKGWYRVCVRL